jgi:hypothetical protein
MEITMADEIKPGRYQHFKGGIYVVIGLFFRVDSEDQGEGPYVAYHACTV